MIGVEPLRPAYGRVYKTLAELQKDFNAGKDFKIASGAYATKKELNTLGFAQVEARYGDKLQHKVLLCTTE